MKFRLLSPHYLKLANKECFFEQKETSRETNETATHRMAVPHYLDPKDPTQWNWDPNQGRYRRPRTFNVSQNEEGWLVLTNKKENTPFELLYTGPLTTEMEGLDDESKKVISELQLGYMHPMGEGAFPSTGSRTGAPDEMAAMKARIAELEAKLRQPVNAK